jgi:hypothetical protein
MLTRESSNRHAVLLSCKPSIKCWYPRLQMLGPDILLTRGCGWIISVPQGCIQHQELVSSPVAFEIRHAPIESLELYSLHLSGTSNTESSYPHLQRSNPEPMPMGCR